MYFDSIWYIAVIILIIKPSYCMAIVSEKSLWDEIELKPVL